MALCIGLCLHFVCACVCIMFVFAVMDSSIVPKFREKPTNHIKVDGQFYYTR